MSAHLTRVGDKAMGKRPLTPCFENSPEVRKKMRSTAEIVSPNTENLRFGHVKMEDMDQFKGTMGAFCEITNTFLRKNENVVAESALKDMMNFIQINANYFITFMKNLGLQLDVNVARKDLAAAKVKAEESNKRAVKAEKALEDWNKYFNDYCKSESKKTEESKKRAVNAEKALEDWKKAYNDLSKKAEDSGKRAAKAEKALEDWKKAYKDSSKKAEDSGKRAEKAEKSLEDWKKAYNDHCISSSRKNEESNKRAAKAEKALEDWKKAYKDMSKKAEDSGKRAEKAEKALNGMKMASKAIGFWGIGKALQDFENVVARA